MTILAKYVPMRKVLKEKTVGTARIEHYSISKEEADFSQLRAAITARRNEGVDAGKYVGLYVDGALVMSDTSMEKYSNYEFLRKANGNVLVAGLGKMDRNYSTRKSENFIHPYPTEFGQFDALFVEPKFRPINTKRFFTSPFLLEFRITRFFTIFDSTKEVFECSSEIG